MGLGAGFKLKDLKDKEREKENIKEKDKGEKHKSKHKEKEREKEEDDPGHDANAPSGWTSILEDWFCNGGGSMAGAPRHSSAQHIPPAAAVPSTHDVSSGNIADRAVKEHKKGPYHPLIKHRMMGLYLTVFIHKDIRGLVQGE